MEMDIQYSNSVRLQWYQGNVRVLRRFLSFLLQIPSFYSNVFLSIKQSWAHTVYPLIHNLVMSLWLREFHIAKRKVKRTKKSMSTLAIFPTTKWIRTPAGEELHLQPDCVSLYQLIHWIHMVFCSALVVQDLFNAQKCEADKTNL